MFKALQRLFTRRAPSASDIQLIEEWALQRGDPVKRDRKGQGAVVSFNVEGGPARLEWGPAQRPYIQGRELRVRVDLGLPPSLEMMVMSRPLAQWLESDAYSQLVRGHQTGIDSALPEEQRWLAVFDPLEVEVPEAVHKQFLVLSGSPSHARRWLRGDLANRLQRAITRWLPPDAPLVLMTMRGRLYLRTSAPQVDGALLDGVRGLAETASLRAIACQKRPRPTASVRSPEVRRDIHADVLGSIASASMVNEAADMVADPLDVFESSGGHPSDLMTLPMVAEFEGTDYPSDFIIDPIDADLKI